MIINRKKLEASSKMTVHITTPNLLSKNKKEREKKGKGNVRI